MTEEGKKFDLTHRKYDIKSIIKTNKELMKKFSMEDILKMRFMLKEYSDIIMSENE